MYVQKSADYTQTPPGVHKAVCSRFIDLGTRFDEMYHKDQHRVLISWQIPAERVEIEGEDLPLQHNEFYTWSMNEKANLRKALESWRGATFTEADLAGPPNGFNTQKLIGVGCQLQIMLKENGKSAVSAIMPLQPKADWPAIEGQTTYFQMQDAPLDMEAFERLTDGLKGIIQGSPEWAKLSGGTVVVTGSGGGSFPDDEIPFSPEWRV